MKLALLTLILCVIVLPRLWRYKLYRLPYFTFGHYRLGNGTSETLFLLLGNWGLKVNRK